MRERGYTCPKLNRSRTNAQIIKVRESCKVTTLNRIFYHTVPRIFDSINVIFVPTEIFFAYKIVVENNLTVNQNTFCTSNKNRILSERN